MFIKKLDKADSILKPPVSERLKAGFVVLNPGEEMPEHKTSEKEEILVILEGEAEINIEGEQEIVSAQSCVFIPQEKNHKVKNCGENILKYVYVVSILI
jgi:mannose-6-phosphate isomerase-like protein (cupin superfamily)